VGRDYRSSGENVTVVPSNWLSGFLYNEVCQRKKILQSFVKTITLKPLDLFSNGSVSININGIFQYLRRNDDKLSVSGKTKTFKRILIWLMPFVPTTTSNTKETSMDQTGDQVIRAVGIVGGGKRGLHLLELFIDSPLVRVVYVVDLDLAAPAMERASRENVNVYTEIDQALTAHTVDLIFEVTGSRDVADTIKLKLGDSTTELITHEVVFIILQVVENRDREAKNRVSQEILGIELEIKQSLSGIQQLVSGIHDISEGMNMLSLNARIEAARAGDQGQGFAVVAQKMGESVGSVQSIAREIKKISGKILAVSTKIEMSLDNLN
jgi:hypothetical protein